jgi:hypothetical protein
LVDVELDLVVQEAGESETADADTDDEDRDGDPDADRCELNAVLTRKEGKKSIRFRSKVNERRKKTHVRL